MYWKNLCKEIYINCKPLQDIEVNVEELKMFRSL